MEPAASNSRLTGGLGPMVTAMKQLFWIDPVEVAVAILGAAFFVGLVMALLKAAGLDSKHLRRWAPCFVAEHTAHPELGAIEPCLPSFAGQPPSAPAGFTKLNMMTLMAPGAYKVTSAKRVTAKCHNVTGILARAGNEL